MRTIIKGNVFIIAIAVVISVLIFIFGRHNKKQPATPHQFSYNTFLKQSGWGYEVLVDGKVYIHQDFVPVLPIEKGFRKKEYAEKAATLVMQKLQYNQLPTLTTADLSQICSLDSLAYEQPANQ
jgi:hypothetical protein